MIEAKDTATAISVLLVLVVELATITRDESDNPDGLLRETPLILPAGRVHPKLASVWPCLGRLNYIHVANFLVLGAASTLLLLTEPSPLRTSLGVVVVFVWLSLPILEVDSYGAIADDGDLIPWSFIWHGLTVLVIPIVVILLPYKIGGLLRVPSGTQSFLTNAGNLQFDQTWSFAVIALVIAGSIFVFLKLLERELREISDTRIERESEDYVFSREGWKQIAAGEHDLRTGDAELVSREEVMEMMDRDDDGE
jgi:hypothetical protein